MADTQGHIDGAQDALNRMRRAHRRGTGCHLTREMIDDLYVSLIGQIWDQADPREKENSDA